MRLEFQVASGISFTPRKALLLLKLVGSACEKFEIFGRRELVVCGFAFHDIDGLAKEFEDACFIGWREVQRFLLDAGIKALEQIDAGCLRCLCKPNFVAVNGAFDTTIACNLDGVDCGLGNEATSLIDERFADIADNLFANERACYIVDEHVFSAGSLRFARTASVLSRQRQFLVCLNYSRIRFQMRDSNG